MKKLVAVTLITAGLSFAQDSAPKHPHRVRHALVRAAEVAGSAAVFVLWLYASR